MSTITFEHEESSDADRNRDRLQQLIYGRIPEAPSLHMAERVLLTDAAHAHDAVVERWRFEARASGSTFGGELLLVLPAAPRLHGLLICQLFQRRPSPLARIEQAILRGEEKGRTHPLDIGLELVLGRHIHVPPMARIARAGFALCLFCPGDIVPDNRHTAPAVLERLAGPDMPRAGALAAWAAITSGVRRLAATDPRLSKVPMIAWGHSRHGKAALLAAAFDPAFSGVISHQSGRFGAALTRGAAGESARQIARVYPHWFKPDFARSASFLPDDLDQHQLLAMIAPRPILLGNAKADFWADPKGTFRAAQAASAAYGAYLAPGFRQASLAATDWSGGIVAFSRAGGHGIRQIDWSNFLHFLSAKFCPSADPPPEADQDADARQPNVN